MQPKRQRQSAGSESSTICPQNRPSRATSTPGLQASLFYSACSLILPFYVATAATMPVAEVTASVKPIARVRLGSGKEQESSTPIRTIGQPQLQQQRRINVDGGSGHRLYLPPFDIHMYLLAPIPCQHEDMAQRVHNAVEQVLQDFAVSRPECAALWNNGGEAPLWAELGDPLCGLIPAMDAPQAIQIDGGFLEFAHAKAIPPLSQALLCLQHAVQSSDLVAALQKTYAFAVQVDHAVHTPAPSMSPTLIPTQVPTTPKPISVQAQEDKVGSGRSYDDAAAAIKGGQQQQPPPSAVERNGDGSNNGGGFVGILVALVAVIVVVGMALIWVVRRRRRQAKSRHAKAVQANEAWRKSHVDHKELDVEDSEVALKNEVVNVVAQKLSKATSGEANVEEAAAAAASIPSSLSVNKKDVADVSKFSVKTPKAIVKQVSLQRTEGSAPVVVELDPSLNMAPITLRRSRSSGDLAGLASSRAAAGRVDRFLAASLRALASFHANNHPVGGGGDDAHSGQTPNTGRSTTAGDSSYLEEDDSTATNSSQSGSSNNNTNNGGSAQGTPTTGAVTLAALAAAAPQPEEESIQSQGVSSSPARAPMWSMQPFADTEPTGPIRRTWSTGDTAVRSTSNWMESALEFFSISKSLSLSPDKTTILPEKAKAPSVGDAPQVLFHDDEAGGDEESVPNLTLSMSSSFSSNSSTCPSSTAAVASIPSIPLIAKPGPLPQQQDKRLSLTNVSGHRRVPTPIGNGQPLQQATSLLDPLQSYSLNLPKPESDDDDDDTEFAPDQMWDPDDASVESSTIGSQNPHQRASLLLQSLRAARSLAFSSSSQSIKSAAATTENGRSTPTPDAAVSTPSETRTDTSQSVTLPLDADVEAKAASGSLDAV